MLDHIELESVPTEITIEVRIRDRVAFSTFGYHVRAYRLLHQFYELNKDIIADAERNNELFTRIQF